MPDPARTGLVFDDEPLESILYGASAAGPTPAGLFAGALPLVAEIVQAFERGAVGDGLSQSGALLSRGIPVRGEDLLKLASLIGTLVPNVPRPIVSDRSVALDIPLASLFAAGLEKGDDFLVEISGTALYRYHEGCGRFGEAARVAATLLERAQRNNDRRDEAVMTNNLGYDHLLDRDCVRASACFTRAVELFDEYGFPRFEQANARINLLLARYEISEGRIPDGFETEVNDLLAALGNDWRRRKALILLARIAERRGKLECAVRLARLAVKASEGVPTRLRSDDAEYLEGLEGRKEKGRPPAGTGEADA